jgi:hypothetical protein
MYSYGHGISPVILLTLAVKRALYISNPTLKFLTWMSICQSFLLCDRISVTKILNVK